MNHQILTNIELHRKVYLFQKYTELYAKSPTEQMFNKREQAKQELLEFKFKVGRY